MNTKELLDGLTQRKQVKPNVIEQLEQQKGELTDKEFIKGVFDLIQANNGSMDNKNDRPKNKFEAIEELTLALGV